MQTQREANRADLRKRLIDAAEAQIAERGLKGLTARDVTAQTGCALGALYNAFEDLDRLILHVNSRTLARLGSALAEACPPETGPKETLSTLAQVYVDFALTNFRLWAALFAHRLPDGVEAPDWHRDDHAVLIAQIIKPLSQLRPDLAPATLHQRAKTVFAAVHGVVALALTGRFVATPRSDLPGEVAALVDAMTRGIQG
jgi:AcrR family transcriptional regulator